MSGPVATVIGMKIFGARSGSLSAAVGVSATTPTIVSHRRGGTPGAAALTRRPIGSSPGK